MSALAAELLKLRSTRGWIGFGLALIALAAIVGAGIAGATEEVDLVDPGFSGDLVSGASVAGLIAVLVGITSVTAEWRHGTIARTFLGMPRRLRVILAKELVAFVVGAVLAIVATGVLLAVAIPIVSHRDASFRLDSDVAVRMGQVILASALWGALGVGVGALLKSQTVALVAALLWIILIEGLIVALLGLADLDGVADYLPGGAFGALDGTVEDTIAPAFGGLVALGYVVAFGALGYLRVARSDIT